MNSSRNTERKDDNDIPNFMEIECLREAFIRFKKNQKALKQLTIEEHIQSREQRRAVKQSKTSTHPYERPCEKVKVKKKPLPKPTTLVNPPADVIVPTLDIAPTNSTQEETIESHRFLTNETPISISSTSNSSCSILCSLQQHSYTPHPQTYSEATTPSPTLQQHSNTQPTLTYATTIVIPMPAPMPVFTTPALYIQLQQQQEYFAWLSAQTQALLNQQIAMNRHNQQFLANLHALRINTNPTTQTQNAFSHTTIAPWNPSQSR